MTHEVVDAFFKDQEDLATDVSAQWHVVFLIGLNKLESYVSSGQKITRKSAHALGQVVQMVLLRINRPHDVATRVDEFARRAGDHRQRRGQLGVVGIGSLAHYFAHDGNLSETRTNVVMQIGSDPAAHSFQFREAFLAAASERLLSFPRGLRSLKPVSGNAEDSQCNREQADRNKPPPKPYRRQDLK